MKIRAFTRRDMLKVMAAGAAAGAIRPRPRTAVAQVAGHYYLSSYIGTGDAEGDPYRPAAVLDWLAPSPTWTVLNFGQTGIGLVAFSVRPPNVAGAEYLGDALDIALSSTIRGRIEQRLGVTLAETTLRRIVQELLIVHADGVRWNRLQPDRFGRYRIWLGDALLFDQPSLSGGVSITESFNKADADTLGPDLTWTEVTTDWDVVTNQAASQISAAVARADTDLATTNQYAECDRVTAGSFGPGPICRKDGTGTLTFYHARLNSTPAVQLYRFSAGAALQLGTTTNVTGAAPNTIRVEADGDQISAFHNGTLRVGPITNGDITTGLRCGIRSGSTGANGDIIDNFAAADLAGAAGPASEEDAFEDDAIIPWPSRR